MIAGVIGCVLTYGIWRGAERRRIHDIPNERSMHTSRLAIGAGWAIVAAVALLLPFAERPVLSHKIVIISTMLVLAAISWMDDLKSLPPLLRLAVQAAVIAVCLIQLPADARIVGDYVPLWVERVAAGFGWLWFVNLYNFMDGIDGITGTETIAISAGYVILAYARTPPAELTTLAVVLAGASAGFLIWNWNPSRIILGDVGSIPLGFLLGWLMLDLAFNGHLASAIIIPLYHLADATITLVRRIVTVPEPWKPHREHVYQRAVLSGFAVPQVVLRIAVLDVALIALAVLALQRPVLALLIAAILTTAMMLHLARGRPRWQPSQIEAERKPQTSTSHHTAA